MTDETVANGQQAQDHHIEIRRDVINSEIISGNNNKVVIYHYHLDQQVQAGKKTSLSKLGANPYRGLAAFDVEDADIFFGREKEVVRLWNRLWHLYEQSQHGKLLPRLLPILGPSGSGKSSLVRAGLLPELARRPLPGYKKTRVLIIKPGNTPLEKLALILARIAKGEPSPVGKTEQFKEVLEKRHEQGTNDGFSYIAGMLPEQDYPLVVLVDQFEEIYSSDADPKQRVAFVETLLEAVVTRKVQVSVVITLRSDFLGETQRHPKLNQIIGSDQSVFLPVMTRAELRSAIEKPAERAGHPLDFATVDQLVEQTEGREGTLPLLQFALIRMWEELGDSNFSKSSKDIVRNLGGVGGALAAKAEDICRKLEKYDLINLDIVQHVFLGLAQPQQVREGARFTRRRVKVSSLFTREYEREKVQKILDRFSSPSARLITLSSIDSEKIAEVTHEALFENWERLKKWLEKWRNLLQQRDRIEDAAEQWQQQGQKRGYLLQGRQLDDARGFHKRYAGTLPLSAIAVKLVRRSLRQRWVSRFSIASLAIIPLIAVEGYLREEFVKRDYATLRSNNVAGKPESVKSLVEGCWEIWEILETLERYSFYSRLSPLLKILGERRFGNCRSLKELSLEQVNLTFADLRSANFINTDLSSAIFKDADLYEANLSGANLSGAQFIYTNLDSAFFYNANLSHADLSGAIVKHAAFDDANLTGTDLRNIREWETEQLSQAKLCETKFPIGANLNPDRDCNELRAIPDSEPAFPFPNI